MRKALSWLLIPLLALALVACGGSAHHSQVPRFGGRTHSATFLQSAEHPQGLTFPRFSAQATLSGYDAVTVSNLPHDGSARVVGCYATGTFANCTQARADFPSAHIVTITPTASFVPATCLDTEPGDSTPDQVAGWIARDRAAGVRRPCDYADSSEMVAVRLALRALPRSSYLLWVAAWDGNPAIPSGFDAHQWFSNCCEDRDTFSADFFASAPKPKPKPRLICWGKHSTPRSSACRSIEQQAAKLWKGHTAFARALARQQHEAGVIQGRISSLQQNSTSVHVAAYSGPGFGFLSKRVAVDRFWSDHDEKAQRTLVAKYRGT